jgi:hypothetical protein
MFFSRGPKRIDIQPTFDVTDEFLDYTLIHASLGPNLEICCLGVNSLPQRIEGMFTPSKTETNHQYKVLVLNRDTKDSLVLYDQKWNYHFIQPLGDNERLVVAARCTRYEDGSYDLNGKVFSSEGILIREFLLGDGIQGVATTKNGRIWTSYFDEGVFGNYGWDHPVGSSGLLAWDKNGERIFSYNGEAGYICDCYALNVLGDDDVWFYFYTDFNLVHLSKDSMISYKPGIDGSDGFVIYDKYVLFRGGYDDHDTYTLFEIGDNQTLQKQKDIIFTDGISKIQADTIYCRGQHMLIQVDMKLYHISLDEIIRRAI